MGSTTLDQAALADLARTFRGEVIQPGGLRYGEHRRIWNASIERHPAAILRCADVKDVRAAVRFGSRAGVPVAVRGGGHSFPGHSTCDGIVIDLSRLREIRVDPVRRTARAQGGVLLGELDRETQAFGLAAPAGIVTHTGLAGLTLGGGIGWLMRRYGLTIDQLLSVELVTAAGDLVTASESENPELFWGVRGGGGNFGVVTDFEFRLNPVGPVVVAGAVVWPLVDAPEVLRFYRSWIADVPDELTTVVAARRIPATAAFPAELHGRPAVMVIACWCGPVEDGLTVLEPLKSFGTPLADLCEPKLFLDHQAMFDPSFPHGRWYYMRSTDVAALTDDVVDAAIPCAEAISSDLSSFVIFQLGGAVARVPEDATAFGGRGSGHTFNLVGSTLGPDGFEDQRDWVRKSFDALSPYSTGVYVNFLGDEGADRVREVYGAERYARLQALKREYDPQNLFRLNQNIPPG